MRAFQDAIKANDPAQHRLSTMRTSDLTSAPSLSPQSKAFVQSQSGRRSVADRPSSVASSASGAGSTPAAPRYSTGRAKTPNARPTSRTSDVFTRSVSRAADHPFDVGENVRIESLGFEGVLCYLGSIDGKPGEWAGVELSGGFAGKGKNDGSVNGRYYFQCPPKCGLSPPTVGPGAVSRPSSVASSHGRMTPSFSGRVTPSSSAGTSGGRITPASTTGRISHRTPSARMPSDATFDPPKSTGPLGPMHQQVSGGSPTRIDLPSMSASATSSPSSSAKTPRPSAGRVNGVGLGLPSTTPTKGRSSVATLRGRIPSAIAMPPPMSPVSASRHVESGSSAPQLPQSGSTITEDSPMDSRLLQDKIANLMFGKGASSSPSPDPGSDDVLATRVAQLEAENGRLNGLLSSSRAEELENERRSDELREDRNHALVRVSDLEASVKALERSLHERDVKIDGLEKLITSASEEAKKSRREGENRTMELQILLNDAENRMKELREALVAKEEAEKRTSTALQSSSLELTTLRSRLEQAHHDLEEERKEVDALRSAGQETIALYEERLSEGGAQRYEMQEEIASLKEKLRIQAEPVSPASKARMLSSAAEIENETLRDQNAYLQKKITSLEDSLEEARSAAHLDETQFREKFERYKEKEENLRRQLADKDKEAERVLKAEATARTRVEEIEEAFREGTVALENAQVEIEGLRAEIANLESQSIVRSTSTEDVGVLGERVATLSAENAELRERLRQTGTEIETLRKKVDRDQPLPTDPPAPSLPRHESAMREELAGLKHIIQELQKENAAAAQQNKVLESENKLLLSETERLREASDILENAEISFLREKELPHEDVGPGGGAGDVQRALKDTRLRHEVRLCRYGVGGGANNSQVELEQLKKRLSESEMKSARKIHGLNKEIGELESLVESKQDELEQEIERLKDRLSRTSRKFSKNASEVGVSRSREDPPSSASTERSMSRLDVCEICEQPGHDIFTCDILKGSTIPASSFSGPTASSTYCEDCDSYGHTAADCPHSTDVF
ncbi:hypothetical protein K488DRAFT_81051 [Vararia minispora EC-137]|uniref:Uncharacterized protein n=1 Tax=Vararia minispora EC-137 TaxID=1314806 RepID=A0ACB8Q737_9AGAM|nr:hypothetical protein K488DRAFT_81051 [Vararia minispora EC-137]